MKEELPPAHQVRWQTTYRLIPSRYPPIDLFERVADPSDWELIAEIEGLTNDRLRHEVGDISLVPVHERIAGPGASPVMAAFTHIGFPSRFSDGSYGVYYAASRIDTAIAEVAYHLERFCERTAEPAFRSEYRTYLGGLDAVLHDVRGGWPRLHAPDDYGPAQAMGQRLRALGSAGVVYDSVRDAGGQCLGAFRPRTVGMVIQGPHFYFRWDGSRVSHTFRLGDREWQALPAPGAATETAVPATGHTTRRRGEAGPA